MSWKLSHTTMNFKIKILSNRYRLFVYTAFNLFYPALMVIDYFKGEYQRNSDLLFQMLSLSFLVMLLSSPHILLLSEIVKKDHGILSIKKLFGEYQEIAISDVVEIKAVYPLGYRLLCSGNKKFYFAVSTMSVFIFSSLSPIKTLAEKLSVYLTE